MYTCIKTRGAIHLRHVYWTVHKLYLKKKVEVKTYNNKNY